VVFQVDQRGGIALVSGKEVFINTKDAGASAIAQFAFALLEMELIAAFDRSGADVMCLRELSLRDATVMGFKHFESISVRSVKPWFYAFEAMAKIAMTVEAAVFRDAQMQRHDLIVLSRVLDSALMSGFDVQFSAIAVEASRP